MTRAALVAALALAGCAETETVTLSAEEHGAALLDDPGVSEAPGNTTACLDCHAIEAGPGRLPGAPLTGAVGRPSFWGGQEASLLAAINHCRYYFMLSNDPWTGEEEEARAVWAYLASIPGSDADREPVPFTLGAVLEPGPGDGVRGEQVYADACGSCHGARNTGAGREVPDAPVLPEDFLAEHPLDEYSAAERRLVFVEKTRHGGFLGYGGRMPPFSREVLSDPDLADVLAYLEVPAP